MPRDGSAVPPSELELDVRPASAPPGPPRPFTAAVAECAWAAGFPEQDLLEQPDTPWRRNMDIVRRYADTAAGQGADILVLSEYAIIKLLSRAQLVQYAAKLPAVDDVIVPCVDLTQHEVVWDLSCLARTHQMYIVANYIEKEPCSPDSDPSCPEDGFSLYNTDLVFDRNGALIQRYRKFNLFGPELETLQTPAPHLSAFRTDFGAVIGLMTCFDILFEVPGVEMARRGVTQFAFPTDWGDQLPSLTALQMHSAWPRGLGVTLLSSGLHRLSHSSIGSGIYTGSGALAYVYDYSSGGAEGGVVTATVPVNGAETAKLSCSPPVPRAFASGGNNDEYYRQLRYDVSEFVSVPLTRESVTGKSVRLCDGDFCCELTFSEELPELPTTAVGGATYRLLVLDGRRNFPPHWSSRVCAVVLCADGSQESCSTFPGGALPPPLPAFSLTGAFGGDWSVFPSVIRTHMELADEWSYDRAEGRLEVTDTERLMVAQLYGRNYALDDLPYEPRISATDTSITSSPKRDAAAPMS